MRTDPASCQMLVYNTINVNSVLQIFSPGFLSQQVSLSATLTSQVGTKQFWEFHASSSGLIGPSLKHMVQRCPLPTAPTSSSDHMGTADGKQTIGEVDAHLELMRVKFMVMSRGHQNGVWSSRQQDTDLTGKYKCLHQDLGIPDEIMEFDLLVNEFFLKWNRG